MLPGAPGPTEQGENVKGCAARIILQATEEGEEGESEAEEV